MKKLQLFFTALMAFTTLTANAETKKHYGIAGPQLIYQKEVQKEGSYKINGVGYTTRTHSDTIDYTKEGSASYYHNSLAGNPTANGEIYYPTQFTAAHKTLPLGSYAVVTNLRNNRKVIVKINDRGPFVKTRIIDLSKIAAQEIGMLSSGIAKVRVEALHVAPNGSLSGAGVSTLAKAARTKEALARLNGKSIETTEQNPVKKTNSMAGTYTVRILNVQNKKQADELIAKLAKKNITTKVKQNSKGYEVYLENITTKSDVYQLKNTLSKLDKKQQLTVYTYN